MIASVLTQAWQLASKDLGIEVVAPYRLMLKCGVAVEATLLVRDFGASRGMLLSITYEQFRVVTDELVAEGYGYSVFSGKDLSYDQTYFVEILNDWGWTGPENRRPSWSK